MSLFAVFAILFGVLTSCGQPISYEEWLRETNQLAEGENLWAQSISPSAGATDTVDNTKAGSDTSTGAQSSIYTLGDTFDYKGGYETLMAKNNTLQSDLNAANSKITTLKGDLEAANGQVDTLETQLSEANTLYTETKIELNKTSERAHESEIKYTQAGQDNISLRAEKTTLEQKIEELTDALAQAKENCSKKVADITEKFEKEIEELKLHVMTAVQESFIVSFFSAYEFGTSIGYTVTPYNYQNFVPIHMGWDGVYEVGGIWAIYNMRIEHSANNTTLVSYKASYNLEDVHVLWSYDMNDVYFGGDNDLILAIKGANIIAELDDGSRFLASFYSTGKDGTFYIQSSTDVLGYEEVWAKKIGNVGWLATVISNAIGRDTTTGELKLKLGYAPAAPATPAQQSTPTKQTVVQDPDVHIPGKVIQDPDVHVPGQVIYGEDTYVPGQVIYGEDTYVPGQVIYGEDVHVPGQVIQDPDVHIPGQVIQDPDVHIPGQVIQDPDVHIPGQVIQDPDIHIPGQVIHDPVAEYDEHVHADPDKFTDTTEPEAEYDEHVTADPSKFHDAAFDQPFEPSEPTYTGGSLEPSGPSYIAEYAENDTIDVSKFQNNSNSGNVTTTIETYAATTASYQEETYAATSASSHEASETYAATSASKTETTAKEECKADMTTTATVETYGADGSSAESALEPSVPTYGAYDDRGTIDPSKFGG